MPTCRTIVRVGLVVVALAGSAAWAEAPRATRDGRTITVEGIDLKFEIPQDWLDWYDHSHNNLHVTPEELAAVKDGAGEWDTEYGQVVNAALPFDRCAAHLGGEGWGAKSVSYADLQMRAYLMDDPPGKLEVVIDRQGTRAIQAITNKQVSATHGKDGAWRKAVFAFELSYGDYGGTAHVDFRMRRVAGQTLVFAFMYTDFESQEKTIGAILASTSSPKVEAAPPKASAEELARIALLVKQLGSEKAEDRDAAQAELTTLGAPAFDALKAAVGSTDAEVRERAHAVLDYWGEIH